MLDLKCIVDYIGAVIKNGVRRTNLPSGKVTFSIAILIALMFSKFIYMASLTSYYTFYLINKFSVPVQTAQVYLFVFLGAVALGTLLGGPVGDRVGRGVHPQREVGVRRGHAGDLADELHRGGVDRWHRQHAQQHDQRQWRPVSQAFQLQVESYWYQGFRIC